MNIKSYSLMRINVVYVMYGMYMLCHVIILRNDLLCMLCNIQRIMYNMNFLTFVSKEDWAGKVLVEICFDAVFDHDTQK